MSGRTVAAKTGEQRQRRAARRARNNSCFRNPPRLLAWYDRHRRDAAVARAAGRARRSLPGLALRDHAAADDGEGGRRPITPVSCSAGPTCRRSRRRRSTTCSRPGPGSAITPARAICTPAPAPWSSATAAISRERRRAARAARHRRLYRRGDRRDRVRRAGDAGRRQYRARGRAALCRRTAAAGAKPEFRRWRARSRRRSAPAISPRR